MIQEILIQLDIRTFINFRYTNKLAVLATDYLHQFKAITTHARNALQGILCVGPGGWITCQTLYEKICTYGCEHCGDFGGYLYLLTCKRVCFLCLSRERNYLPLLRSHARLMFGLGRQTVEPLPHMRILPGVYSPNEKKAAPSVLIDYESALRAGIALHGSLSDMQHFVERMRAQKDQERTKRLLAARVTGSRQLPRRSWTQAGSFDGHAGNPLRFVAIVRVPWLNTTLQEEDWGSHCNGCQKSSHPPLHYRRKFTAASFDAHLSQCGRIIDGKHCLETS